MSKLNIDQKTVKELFSAKKTKFLIFLQKNIFSIIYFFLLFFILFVLIFLFCKYHFLLLSS